MKEVARKFTILTQNRAKVRRFPAGCRGFVGVVGGMECQGPAQHEAARSQQWNNRIGLKSPETRSGKKVEVRRSQVPRRCAW